MYNWPALTRGNWRTFYGNLSIGDAKDSVLDGIIQRAEYNTSDAQLVNDIFGAVIYAQYNQEHNWLAALPVEDRTGENWSVGDAAPPKAYRAAHSPVSLQTHSEGGSISDGVTMEVEEFSVEVKRSETNIRLSDLQDIESVLEDAVSFENLWELQQEQLNLAIQRDAIGAPALEADSDYEDVDEITPLDRAIASQDEENNADDTGDSSFTSGALDYGSVTRASVTWADSYVDHNGTSGNRQLTRDLMDDFLAGLGDNGDADPYDEGVIFTDRTAAKVLSDLMADSTRGSRITFDGEGGSGTDSVNDAQTLIGLAGTTRFRHYDGIPMIVDQNAPTDGIGRIFVVPMGTVQGGAPRVCIEQYAEPYMERAGRGLPQGYIAQGNYEERALFVLNHELKINDFASCGKLRDLSE